MNLPPLRHYEGSYVVKRKSDDEVICELFRNDPRLGFLNTDKYYLVGILEHLGSLNKK